MGGDLIARYKLEETKALSNYDVHCGVSISRFEGLTLKQYVEVRKFICKMEHKIPCKSCPGMIQVASVVDEHGYWKLKDAFCCIMEHDQPCKQPCESSAERELSPAVKNYTSAHAKSQLLRMPLSCVAVEIGPTQCVNFLVKKDANITLMKSLLGRLYRKTLPDTTLSKERVKDLLRLCEGDTQKECLHFGLAEASGLSIKMIKKRFGFANINERKARVIDALQKAEEIRASVQQLANIKEKAVLMSLGMEVSDSDTDNEASESESDVSSATESEMVIAFGNLATLQEMEQQQPFQTKTQQKSRDPPFHYVMTAIFKLVLQRPSNCL